MTGLLHGKLLNRDCLRPLAEAQETSAVHIVSARAASSLIQLSDSVVSMFLHSSEIDSGLQVGTNAQRWLA